MDWSLVSTVVGALLALGGGALTGWWAERRSKQREFREWQRSLDSRLFESRKSAYVLFLQGFRTAMDTLTGEPGAPDWGTLETLVTEIQLVGSQRAYQLARDLRRALEDYELDLDPDRLTDLHAIYNTLVAEARVDLGSEVTLATP